MSLESRLAAPPAPKNSQTILDRWYDGLSEKEQTAVRNAVTDKDWRHVDLQRVLEDEGAPKLADTSFGSWRRRRAEEWA